MTEFGVAIAAASSLLFLSKSYSVRSRVDDLVMFVDGDLEFVVVASVLAILPTTFLMGLAFPIGVRVYVGDDPDTGRRIGAFYGFNVAAGIAGSLVAGFVLVPVLGTRRTLIVLVLASVSAALVLAFSGMGGTARSNDHRHVHRRARGARTRAVGAQPVHGGVAVPLSRRAAALVRGRCPDHGEHPGAIRRDACDVPRRIAPGERRRVHGRLPPLDRHARRRAPSRPARGTRRRPGRWRDGARCELDPDRARRGRRAVRGGRARAPTTSNARTMASSTDRTSTSRSTTAATTFSSPTSATTSSRPT